MATRTALVTGAAGFLGLNLVEQLLAAGWQVFALHRQSSDLTYLARFKVSRLAGSITDRDWLLRTVPDGLDAIFHAAADKSLAARGNAGQTLVNVEGTRNMVEVALARRARRFIHTSSVAAFGAHGPTPITERTSSNAAASRINYSRTKWLAEEEVRKGLANGLDAVILNPANIVGRYDWRNWATMILLIHQRRLPGIGPGSGAFCAVTEVAKAHLAAFERGRRGEAYLLGGVHASYVEFAQVIAAVVGGKAPRRPVPAWLMAAMGRVMPLLAGLGGKSALITPEVAEMISFHFRVDSSKAVRELGYGEVPLAAMVADACAWLKAEGRLV